MSGSRRLERLNSQLQREINELLRVQVRDPRVEGVRVTYVRTTSDLWLARVYVQIPADGSPKDDAMEGLESAAPFIRTSLAEMLRVRRVPELRFLEDETLAHARRIDEILEEVLPATDEAPSDEEE